MGASDPLLQLVCSLLVLAIPVSLLVVFRPLRARRHLAPLVAGSAGAVASLAVDVVIATPADAPARILDAALAAAIAASVAVLASLRLGTLGGAVFGAAWSIIVFQPVIAAIVGSVPSLVQTVFGAVDYGGVLVTHVAAAASLVVLHALPVPPRTPAGARPPASAARALAATLLLTVGATAWMVGVERVVNAATGRTFVNAVVGMLLAAMVWAVIERIAGRPFVPAGLVAGAAVGWAAIGLGVPFLSPAALAATVVIGVSAGAAVVVRAPAGADLGRRGAIAVILAAAIGGVILALLADGFGLAATGYTAPVVGQLGAVLAISLGAAGSGALCWMLAAGAIVVHERGRAPVDQTR